MAARTKPKHTPRSAKKTVHTEPVKAKTLLFRLRLADSPNGISARTLKRLAVVLDIPETQVIHQALRKLADDFIPAYEADNGPVSDRMLEAIKARVPQGQYKSVSSSLF
jgi:hypothetical protein